MHGRPLLNIGIATMKGDDKAFPPVGFDPSSYLKKFGSYTNDINCPGSWEKSGFLCTSRTKLRCILFGILVIFTQPVNSNYNECQKFAISENLQEITRAANLLEIHIRQNIQVSLNKMYIQTIMANDQRKHIYVSEL